MFKSEDSRPNYAEMLSLADRGGISDDNIDTILNRMSPPPPSMPLASKSNLINGFDAEVSTYNSRQASSMNLTGFDSNSRFVPIKEAPPPHFDPEGWNCNFSWYLVRGNPHLHRKKPVDRFDKLGKLDANLIRVYRSPGLAGKNKAVLNMFLTVFFNIFFLNLPR